MVLLDRVRTARVAAMAATGGFCLGALLWAAPALAAGSIAVSPSTVPAGGTVTISGSVPTTGSASCAPGDAAMITSVAALFPPDGFGPQAARDTQGGFSVSYTVPASTPPGTYALGVRCGGGNVGVSTDLTVTAQVQRVPSGAPAAGLGGASRVSADRGGWVAAGALAALLAAGLAGAGVWRARDRRRRA
jgi:alpha-L-fucosidase